MKQGKWYLATFPVVLILVSAAFSTLPFSQGVGQQTAATARCDLVAAYGTVVIVPGGREQEVTEDNRAGLLEGVRLCAETLLGPDTLATYRQKDALLDGSLDTNQNRADRDLLRVEIASLLSKDASVQQQRAVARRIAGGANALALAVQRQGAEPVLSSSGWSLPDTKAGSRHDMAAYIKACELAHVPIPKSLGTDKEWSTPVELGGETGRYLILQEKRDATVWTYKSSAGGYCVTLRRQNPDNAGELPLIGTICENAEETQACFFDNVVADGSGSRRLDLEEYKSTDLSSLLHPMDEGNDVCSTCHIGANPFLVDPRTVLGTTVAGNYGPKKGGQHFEFAGLGALKGGWHNLGLIKGPGCMQCHDLPEIPVLDKFCDTIIQQAANTTMPPGYWEGKPDQERNPLWPGIDGCFDRSFADLATYTSGASEVSRKAIFESLRQINSICSGVEVPECPNDDGLAKPTP